MVRVSVMYPAGAGKKFDATYYLQKHMPLVRERLGPLGLLRAEADKGIAGGAPDSPPPFAYIAQLYFNSLADFQKAMGVHGKELMGDVPNYTDIQLQVQISEIVG